MTDSIPTGHTVVPVAAPPELPVPEAPAPALPSDLAMQEAQELLLRQAMEAHSKSTPQKSREKNVTNPLPESKTDTVSAENPLINLNQAKPITYRIEKPAAKPQAKSSPAAVGSYDNTSSWLILGFILLFLLIAFRIRRNFKYLKGMMQETIDSRQRRNMFTDTARENSFSLLLNLLSIACMGLLLSIGMDYYRTGAPHQPGEFSSGLWVCMAISGGYYFLQLFAYLLIGHIFVTPHATAIWVQGFRAGTGLSGLLLFPIALLCLFYPAYTYWLLAAALFIYFLTRILFIFKGIRIFSTFHTYYMLFLYYLCSVEIVPVVLILKLACDFS